MVIIFVGFLFSSVLLTMGFVSQACCKSATPYGPNWAARVMSGLGGNLGNAGCRVCRLQATKPEPRTMRYELTEHAWAAVKPMLSGYLHARA